MPTLHFPVGSAAPGPTSFRRRRTSARPRSDAAGGSVRSSPALSVKRDAVVRPLWQPSPSTATAPSSVRARDATRNNAGSIRTRGGDKWSSATSSKRGIRTIRTPAGRRGVVPPARPPRSSSGCRGPGLREPGAPRRRRGRPAPAAGRRPRHVASTTAARCDRQRHPGGHRAHSRRRTNRSMSRVAAARGQDLPAGGPRPSCPAAGARSHARPPQDSGSPPPVTPPAYYGPVDGSAQQWWIPGTWRRGSTTRQANGSVRPHPLAAGPTRCSPGSGP